MISPSGQVAAVEIEDQPPALDGGLHPIHGSIDRKEAVTGILEAVELVLLAEPGELGVDLRDLRGCRVLVLGPEQPEDRDEIFGARSITGCILYGNSGGELLITKAP